MLAIEVEYLLGRAVATDASQRDVPEWPPHPSRLFSALVDALADVSAEAEHAACEDALRWLETQPPPEIGASLGEQVSSRSSVKYFVAINDEVADAKNVRAAPLAELRTRQERYFPAVVPADPKVCFAWPRSEPTESQREALDDLAKRVPYLGHSSSLGRVSCLRAAPPRALAPALAGSLLLRVPGPGRLDRLNAVHTVRRRDTLVQPPKGREVPYAPVGATYSHGPHGSARVFAFEGARFGIEDTAWVTHRYREAFLSKLTRSAPEILTGHLPGGAKSTRAHVAFVPLANVLGRHADGSIKGIAVVIPRDADERALILLESAVNQISTLAFGARGEIGVHPIAVDDEDLAGSRPDKDVLFSLRFGRYAGVADTWMSVTPVALGLHPKPEKGLTEEIALARDLADLGLPEPVEVRLENVSFARRSSPARSFKRGEVSALRGRVLRHVLLRFAEPVSGPLLVGAGRHMGFGLLLPTRSES